MTTARPACAATCAIPFPICPAPTTPSVRTFIGSRRIAMPTAFPPPRQSAAIPFDTPRSSSAWSSVVRMRAPGSADRMAERDRAAADVVLGRVQTRGRAASATCCTGERLVELVEVHAVGRPARLLPEHPHRLLGRHHHELGASPDRRVRDDLGARGRARGAWPSPSRSTTTAAAPSLTPGAFPAVTVPSFLNAGFSALQRLDRRLAAGDSSVSNRTGSPFLLGIVDRHDLALEHRRASIAAIAFLWLSSAHASWSSRVTFQRSATTSPGVPHVVVVVGVPETVVDHRVVDRSDSPSGSRRARSS